MHIPDGFLTNPICAATTATAIVGIAGVAALARRSSGETSSGRVAVLGGAIFAAQMINSPVAEGTSGHLIGAALATAMLGPASAILTLVTVLAVQCLIFGDGGIYALGGNVLNMALIGVVVSQAILIVAERMHLHRWLGIALAAWCSVLAAALACSIELAISGVASLSVVTAAMLKVHALIGLSEACITVVVIALVRSTSPVVRFRASIGLGSAVAVAVVMAPLASSLPDGLEKVAESLGFAERATAKFAAPIADYLTPGISTATAATAIAGLIGVLVVFLLLGLLTRWQMTQRR